MFFSENSEKESSKEIPQNFQSGHSSELKLLPVYTGLFTGTLILSNILATKILQLGPFNFDGGTLLFPLSYIFGDVLTEVYGYKQSRKVIWTGMVMLIIMAIIIPVISFLPADPTWTLQESFDSVLLQMPRIALASILGYFSGSYSNAVLLSFLKVKTKGKYLWLRTISSTLLGELVDSALFVLIAFTGLYTPTVLISIIMSNYIFKSLVEIVLTPITYYVIAVTKKTEQMDVYDREETYNPLPVSSR